MIPVVVSPHSSLIGTGAYIAIPTMFHGHMVMGYQGGEPPLSAWPKPPAPEPEPKPPRPKKEPMDAGLSGTLGRIESLMRERNKVPPDEVVSGKRTREEPAGQTENEREEGNRSGDEKVLREFDYVRAGTKGKGLVMGIATPPPNQVVIVKLNAAPYPFLPLPSVDLSLLGHLYQGGHLPDVPGI